MILNVDDMRREARRRVPRAVLEKTLALLGCPRIAELDRSVIRHAHENLRPLS